ncbi:MAG: hypothetical protein J6S45_08370 [Firmicutes bacterium]|nr:hypothetical protein [Bacillota bacterium]
METILVLAVGTLNIACFLIGVKVGQREEIKVPELPELNPMKAYREHKEREAVRKEMEKLQKIEANMDRYNGTAEGQQDI